MVAIDSTAILHPDIQQRFRHASEIVDRLANCLQAVCASQSVPLLAVVLGGDLAQAFCATAAIDALAVQESLLQGGAVCKVVGSRNFSRRQHPDEIRRIRGSRFPFGSSELNTLASAITHHHFTLKCVCSLKIRSLTESSI